MSLSSAPLKARPARYVRTAYPVVALQRRLAALSRAAAFWAAIAIPFLYAFLLWNGLDAVETVLLAALVCVNVVALVVGHDYHQQA